jgi:uncharacterized protein YciI
VPETLQILQYEYVPDMADKRTPHRQAHLDLIAAYHGDGRIVMGGAVGDPPSAGLIVFRTADAAQAFVDEDPYGAAGLVVKSTIQPWTVVTS